MTAMPSKGSQLQYYDDRWSQSFSKGLNQLELKRLICILQMIDKIPIRDEMKILDLGCGRGWLSAILSHVGATTGIELSSEAVSQARKKYTFVEFREGDLFKVLTEKDTYDIVVSQEVIEHIEDQSGFVNLAADSVKMGGHFIFTTPNAWTQAHRTQEEHEKFGLQPIEKWIDRKGIKELLSLRFQVLEIRSIIDGFGSVGIFRIVNSCKLRKVLKGMGLHELFSRCLLRFDFGPHLVVLAKRER